MITEKLHSKRPLYFMVWKKGHEKGLLVQNNGHPLEIPDKNTAEDINNEKEIRSMAYRDYYQPYIGKVNVVNCIWQQWAYQIEKKN